MNDIHFKAWGKQKNILLSKARDIGVFAGKRGGKTEVGATKSILLQESKPNSKYFYPYTIDPYMGVVIAPTHEMLMRLSWKKFCAYADPMIIHQTKKPPEIKWHDDSEVIGVSGDNPSRLEGVKSAWIWIDEIFQISEALYLEAKARVSDSEGTLLVTGSLGTQVINPKSHWAYKYFVEQKDPDVERYEWATADNPYFPVAEIERLRRTLDPMTFRQMFTIDWDVLPSSAVYGDFSDDNIIDDYHINPNLKIYCSIDWGWNHPMAVLFYQYDEKNDEVYLFDEIVESHLTLPGLWEKIINKGFNIQEWSCDIAGNQEREQTGISNVQWFKSKGIKFKYRSTAVNYGVPIVRSYIMNTEGRRRLLISRRCKKTIDGIKMYRYPEKDGKVINENPLKLEDDACDSLRYFAVNVLDPALKKKGSKIYYYG